MTDLTITALSSEKELQPFHLNATEFSIFIEQQAINNKQTVLESIMEYCEEHKIDDPGTLTPFITKSLKNKLEEIYKQLNYLKRTAKLDI